MFGFTPLWKPERAQIDRDTFGCPLGCNVFNRRICDKDRGLGDLLYCAIIPLLVIL
jgi:hypothetical protein